MDLMKNSLEQGNQFLLKMFLTGGKKREKLQDEPERTHLSPRTDGRTCSRCCVHIAEYKHYNGKILSTCNVQVM